MVLMLLVWRTLRSGMGFAVHHIRTWNDRTAHEPFGRTLVVSYNDWISEHSGLVTTYLYIALGTRTIVKFLSFLAVVFLVWNGVPGTPFQGLQRPVGVPLLSIFAIISMPIFVVGFFQGWTKIGQWNHRKSERRSLLDDMPI